MDIFIEVILKGIIIGILVSAPLGPIGVLVIQRTLNEGRKAGLATGLGASLSDIVYALASGLGLSVIVDFLHSNESIFQIIGSIVIFAFGLFTWRKNPAADFSNNQDTNTSIGKYIATGFALTLSNPLIIFFFMALYARTNFISLISESTSTLAIGFTSISIGALCWWLFITWIMCKIRNNFNLRSLFLINKVIAIIMFIVSAVGFILGINSFL